MRMYVGVMDKGLDLAFRADPKGKPALIEETKRVARLYLDACVKPLPDPSRQRRRSRASTRSSS